MSNHYEKILKSGLSLLLLFLFSTASESSGYSDHTGLTTEADLQDPQTVKKINANWESRQEGSFLGVDDLKIKYVAILKDDERGAVVISNGRTESYIKYKELAYDLGQQGYSVYIHDHRGQGFSGRMTENRQMGHVWDFDDYVSDLKTFYEEVVSKNEHSKKFLLAHSMGGGIAALYIEKYPSDFDAAALSSPMLEQSTAIFHSDEIVCGAMKVTSRIRDFFIWLFGIEPRYVVGGKDYNNTPFKDNKLTHSEIRYERFRNIYEVNEEVKMGGPTSHWVAYACDAAKDARENAAKVTIPVLVLQAGEDTAVTPEGQNEFCENLKLGGQNECDGGSPFVIEGAYHELFIEKDEYRIPALSKILDFFSAQSK